MFTPKQINEMSDAEFRQHEKSIAREADANTRKRLRAAGFNVPDRPHDHASEGGSSAPEKTGSTPPPADEPRGTELTPSPEYLVAPAWAPIPANVSADARKLIEQARSAAESALAEARGLYRAWKSR